MAEISKALESLDIHEAADLCGGTSGMSTSFSSMSDGTDLRNAMHHFIDFEFNLTPLASEYLGPDLYDNFTSADAVDQVRKCMHEIAEDMDMDLGMQDAHGRTQGPSEYGSSESAGRKDVLHVCNGFNSEMPTKASQCLTLPRSLQDRLISKTRHLIESTNRDMLEYFVTHWNRAADSLSTISFYYPTDDVLLERERQRDRFLESAALQPPAVLRVIDIEATCRLALDRVVLLDYWADASVQQKGYSAISHTYGMEVYEVFDCQCATEYCSPHVSRPRCSDRLCPHVHDEAVVDPDTQKRNRVVKDILRMCDNLMATGVQYAWHDGVCIAQFDNLEVEATIKCMGWIYNRAKETIVFLHYVGRPMAPIRNGDVLDELTCRWHTRVWTLQEAALSKCRRYCVRVGTSHLGECQNLEEFEQKIALWYKEESSRIEVIEENWFIDLLAEIREVLLPLLMQVSAELKKELFEALSIHSNIRLSSLRARIRMMRKAQEWRCCILNLYTTVSGLCILFPTARSAMRLGSCRESKHVGDHINSILALSGVVDFVAPKDARYMEASTIEFFKRQGRKGLEYAVFATNAVLDEDGVVFQHTWIPLLSDVFDSVIEHDEVDSGLEYRVVEDGIVELKGEMLCVKVEFTVKVDKGSNEDQEGGSDERAAMKNCRKRAAMKRGVLII